MAKKKYYEKSEDEQLQNEEFEESEGRSGSNIKIETVLLAVIAVALVVQTFIMISGSGESDNPAYVPSNNNQPAAMNQPQQPQMQQQQRQPQAQQTDAQPPQFQMDPQQTPQQQQPPASDPNATTANYSETTHDFGAVSPTDGNLTHTFTVTNAGDKPLSYSNVRGDAGITVTKYPTDPVPPGGKGEITVQFDPSQAKGEGTQAYNVHLDGNTNPGHQHLVIQAAVNK